MSVLRVDYQSDSANRNFVKSIKETGFAVLENHPVDKNLIDQAFDDWKGFFALPEAEKQKFLFERDFEVVQSGFFPQTVSETAKGFTAKDLKEFFHYYPCAQKLPPCISEATTNLRLELLKTAKVLLQWLEDFLPSHTRDELSMPLTKMVDETYQTLLRILHYPPLPKTIESESIRAQAHEDINLITLLVSPSSAGLEVLDTKGNWYEVPTANNHITVNVGDMLQECSNHYYRATKHRVVNPKGQKDNLSRYSMPLFLHPRDEVSLSSQYTAKSYRNERLKELGLL